MARARETRFYRRARLPHHTPTLPPNRSRHARTLRTTTQPPQTCHSCCCAQLPPNYSLRGYAWRRCCVRTHCTHTHALRRHCLPALSLLLSRHACAPLRHARRGLRLHTLTAYLPTYRRGSHAPHARDGRFAARHACTRTSASRSLRALPRADNHAATPDATPAASRASLRGHRLRPTRRLRCIFALPPHYTLRLQKKRQKKRTRALERHLLRTAPRILGARLRRRAHAAATSLPALLRCRYCPGNRTYTLLPHSPRNRVGYRCQRSIVYAVRTHTHTRTPHAPPTHIATPFLHLPTASRERPAGDVVSTVVAMMFRGRSRIDLPVTFFRHSVAASTRTHVMAPGGRYRFTTRWPFASASTPSCALARTGGAHGHLPGWHAQASHISWHAHQTLLRAAPLLGGSRASRACLAAVGGHLFTCGVYCGFTRRTLFNAHARYTRISFAFCAPRSTHCAHHTTLRRTARFCGIICVGARGTPHEIFTVGAHTHLLLARLQNGARRITALHGLPHCCLLNSQVFGLLYPLKGAPIEPYA